jgi:hypothetical protein
MSDTYIRMEPTRILLDVLPSQETLVNWLSFFSLVLLGPLTSAACDSPDPVSTTQDTDKDEITEADNIAGDATFSGAFICGTRQVTQPSMPADLHISHISLAMSTTFGPKLF